MSMPPPPPPGGTPPPPPPNFGGPPPGYEPYGQPASAAAPKTNGMSIASLVLSLVGLIPCFWFFQIPAILGVIFGFVGRRQIGKAGGAQKGSGLALAGIIVGAILIVLAIALIVALVLSDDGCFQFGTNEYC